MLFIAANEKEVREIHFASLLKLSIVASVFPVQKRTVKNYVPKNKLPRKKHIAPAQGFGPDLEVVSVLFTALDVMFIMYTLNSFASCAIVDDA